MAVITISLSVVQAQEVAPANTTKKHPKSTKKTAEVAKKETTPEKQTEVKTVTSAEARKKKLLHISTKLNRFP